MGREHRDYGSATSVIDDTSGIRTRASSLSTQTAAIEGNAQDDTVKTTLTQNPVNTRLVSE